MSEDQTDGATVGMDAGGTKSEVYWSGPGSIGQSLVGPGVNLMRDGKEAATGVFIGLLEEVSRRAGSHPILSLCIGLAGAGRRHDQEALEHRIGEAWPERLGPRPRVLRVVADGVVALEAALGPESGIVVITGTGSFVLGRLRSGRLVRSGGWGRVLGDDGGGYGLGRAALRAVAAAHDGGPDTEIARLLAERHGISGLDILIRRVYVENWPLQHDPVAALLDAADAGDAVAREIVGEQTAFLADQVRWLVGRFGSDAIGPVVALLGGLSRHDGYASALKAALEDGAPGRRVLVATRRPAEGAFLCAQRLTRGEAID